MNTNINLMRSRAISTIKKLIRCNDIGFVFDNLENLVIMPIPYKEENEDNENYKINKNYALEALPMAEQTIKKLTEELFLRSTTFEYVRETNPDFCTNMENKISKGEYLKYKALLQECIESLTALIYSGRCTRKKSKKLPATRKFRVR